MANLFVRNIDTNVLEAFKTLVINKHGKLHGALSKEVEAALKNYMRSYQTAHNTNNTNLPKSSNKKLQTIVSKLPKATMISSKAIDKVIYQYAGTDPRTVRKYKKILQDLEILKIKQYIPSTGLIFYECNPNLNIP